MIINPVLVKFVLDFPQICYVDCKMYIKINVFSEVYFCGQVEDKPLSVRNVLASSIGHLIQVRGVVTRATEVKPLISIATYTCSQCGAETYQVYYVKFWLFDF